MSHQGITLTILDTAGTQVGILTGEAENLRWSTSAPGGCLECSFLLRRKASLSYVDLGYSYDVRLSDEEGIFWRGVIEQIRPVFDEDAEGIEVVALGGAVFADDETITSETVVSGTSIQSAMSTIRSTYVTKVTAESLETTGRTLNANLVLEDMPAREAWNRLCHFGTSGNVPLYWYVWPDGAGNAHQLVLASKPSVEDYRADISDLNLTWGFDGRLYANRVRVKYSAGWRMVEDTAEQTAVNRTRTIVMRMTAVTNITDADNIGNTVLSAAKLLRASAESATTSTPWAIRDDNQIVELHRVRAGKLLYVQGLPPAAGQAGDIDWHNALFIVRTEYSYEDGTLRLTFERFDTLLEGIMAKLATEAQI